MGREIKHVALDFNWPIDKVWEGYLTPERLIETPCADCYGTGATPASQWVDRIALMLDQLIEDVGAQQAGKPMHPWLAEDTYPPCDTRRIIGQNGPYVNYPVVRPSVDIIEFCQALTARNEDDGYRSIKVGSFGNNKYAISAGLLKSAGLPDKWGWCPTCDGRGSVETYPGQRAEEEVWEPVEPPAGDGWQVWETVSEGSPISPVFADREGLIGWLMSPAYTWGTSKPLTRAQAEGFTADGWAPSLVFTAATGLVPGDQTCGS